MSSVEIDRLDLTQFHEVFFEEAAEHLTRMEELLLAIDPAAADDEDLNAIFRAAHSIKGGAATFGFRDVTGLTHDMETVFDKVRKGTLALSTALVDTFLEAGDALNALLACHRGSGAALAAADVEDLQARLRGFLALPAQALVNGGTSGTASDGASGVEAAPAVASTQTLVMVFGPLDAAFAARHVDAALHDLADFGKIGVPVALPDGTLAAYIHTDVSVDDLRDALAFMVDPERVSISVKDSAVAVLADAVLPADVQCVDVLQVDVLHDDVLPVEPPAAVPAAIGADLGEDSDFGLFIDPASLPANRTAAALAQVRAHLRTQVPLQAATPVETAVAARRATATAAAAPAAHAAHTGDGPSIRVSVEKVDQLINLVGELVITQAMLAQTASDADPVLYERLFNGLAQLERNTRDLQESAMAIRMLPISFVFSRFSRVVRDTAARLGKEVELSTIGEGTELDKGLIERIVDPLTHLVRNSLDHGLELPAERLAAGKPAKGKITLRAYHQGGAIVIEVADDGRGLSRERILAKASERGLRVSAEMSDQEVWQLIFEAGFSTAEQVTDVSGRGVGMDVVRRNILDMDGRVEINSSAGQGTRITIRLPLTLAILDGMSVRVANEIFIIPLGYIRESLQPQASAIRSLQGHRHVVAVRGDYLPVLSLAEVFGIAGERVDFECGILVILEAEGGKVALFVDGLVGQHQVVIKSLESNYRKVPGLSGATIMGDGRVAMILDAAWLVGAATRPHDLAA